MIGQEQPSERQLCIAVSGFPSSGKSTVAKRLGRYLGLEVVSAGSLIRDYARQSGTTLEELGPKLEADRKVDEYVDNEIWQLSQEGMYIFDSRMAWHFVESALKIHLEVSLEQAAERAILRPVSSEETYKDFVDAGRQLNERRRSEVSRYKKFYDVNIEDYDNYDLVIFTDGLSADEVFRIARAFVDEVYSGDRNRLGSPSFFASPATLFPTQSIRELSETRVAEIKSRKPIGCLRFDDQLFVWDGHHRTAKALLEGLPSVEIQFCNPNIGSASVEELLRGAVSKSRIFDWEAALQTTLPKLKNLLG